MSTDKRNPRAGGSPAPGQGNDAQASPSLRETSNRQGPLARHLPKQEQPGASRPAPITHQQQGAAGSGKAPKTGQALLPAVSLPKGGGALRGMGEKLSLDPISGTAGLSIPIAASPGRGGNAPQIALSYDSGAGNGPFGLGWQLSAPAISIKTSKGLPTYTDEDTYVMGDDLVAVGEPTMDGNVSVQRYQPRVEGSFAYIERRKDTTTGITHWEVRDTDNTLSVYGEDPMARIADPSDPTRIFSWMLDRVEDDNGELVRYTYKAENLQGVDHNALSERHRMLQQVNAQRYLSCVEYGNVTPGSAAGGFLFKLVFDYGEYDEAAPTDVASQPWTCRSDPFSSYRAGFELRTYRLCRRVLMFHDIGALSSQVRLVRSTDFTYNTDVGLTRLVAAESAGYDRASDTAPYVRQALPPVSLTYTGGELDYTVQRLPQESLQGLPGGIDGKRARWVDLDGEGIPGVLLTVPGGGVYYKENLGEGKLSAPRPVTEALPTFPRLGGSGRLMDLEGDGKKDLVSLRRPLAGCATRTDAGWQSFRPFERVPTINPDDPTLQLVDLTGDGKPDILLADVGGFAWYLGEGKKGFGPGGRRPVPHDDDLGPRQLVTHGQQAIHLADMSGDGLPDIVRVQNGNVCYWPNLGYGRFGAKVVLEDVPRFDSQRGFDPARLRLADVDGSGATDLLYLEAHRVVLYRNLSGNRLAPAEAIPITIPHGVATVDVLDILGVGTPQLIWSNPLPGARHAPVHYIDLCKSEKPHLLREVRNNLGAVQRLSYAPSTRFYLEDKAAQRPWLTRLHFVVHVVERLEVEDALSDTKLVQRYRYRHGAFDPEEREFRGFAFSEHWDAEELGLDPNGDDPNGGDPLLTRPAVHTKSWVHTGLWAERGRLEPALAAEYHLDGPEAQTLLPDTQLPAGLSPREQIDACRALRGRPLRQEVYADDRPADLADGIPHVSDRPYVTSEICYRLRRVRAAEGDKPPIFLVLPDQTLTHHSERSEGDARVSHQLVLDTDPDYGTIKRSAQVAYGRHGADPVTEQGKLHVVIETAEISHDNSAPQTRYRIGVPVNAQTYALTGVTPADELFTPSELNDDFNDATLIAYEDAPSGSSAEKRLLESSCVRYYNDTLTGPLPEGQLGLMALPYESYTLALSENQRSTVYGSDVSASDMSAAGYVQFSGDPNWWAPSGVATFDPALFYQVTAATDPFGNTQTLTYDSLALAVTKSTDPLGNEQSLEIDYRTLTPSTATDENDNVTAVTTDALGRVTAVAEMGKLGSGEGDTLADPTVTFAYHMDQQPAMAVVRARETHGDPQTRWIEQRQYTDGLGRPLMTKVQAEPGDAPARDANDNLIYSDGELVIAHTADRWVGTGRVVLDNKGQPVKQYEPFFSSTSAYEPEDDVAACGVSAVMHHDPLGRVIQVDQPDGTLSRVDFDPWMQITHDAGDLVLESAWYTNIDASSPDALKRAQELSEAYAEPADYQNPGDLALPTHVYLDSLGRQVRTVEDGGAGIGKLETELVYDLEGQVLEVLDPRGLVAQQNTYDIAGRLIRQVSNDAGTETVLFDVANQPALSWTARGLRVRQSKDALRRPIATYVADTSGDEIVTELMVYGESVSQAEDANLRGQPYMSFDGVGQVVVNAYDFGDKPLSTTRRYAEEFAPERQELDWSALAELTELDDIVTAADGLLEGDSYTTSFSYDALDRVVEQVTPDGAKTAMSYDEGGLLERIEVETPNEETHVVLSDVDENARGQRVREVLGQDGVERQYWYDDKTYRLTRLRSTCLDGGAVLQDLRYTYDVVGNIVQVTYPEDELHFEREVTSGTRLYVYDRLYRLTSSSGREHPGQQPTANSSQLFGQVPHPNDQNALQPYTETYSYDKNGNITQMKHSGEVNWTRDYVIDDSAGTNRLISHNRPSAPDPYTYSYDAAGNMNAMAHISSMLYTSGEQLAEADLGGGGVATYGYAGGERARKVIDHGGWTERRLYLGGWERYRRANGSLSVERDTLHVYEGDRRIALIETLTRKDGKEIPVVDQEPRVRVQLDDHLGSACVEVDLAGKVIGYEEYFAYGATSFRMTDANAGVSARRYRYIGKERDEETGLSYHSARYYAAWLGRWTTSDPAGLVDGPGTYAYCNNSPISSADPNGLKAVETNTKASQNRVRRRVEKALARLKGKNTPEAKATLALATPLRRILSKRRVLPQSPAGWVQRIFGQLLSMDPGSDSAKRLRIEVKRYTSLFLTMNKRSPNASNLAKGASYLARTSKRPGHWQWELRDQWTAASMAGSKTIPLSRRSIGRMLKTALQRDASGGAISSTLHAYLKAFYKHSSKEDFDSTKGGYSWRTLNAGPMSSGRVHLDCEGFAIIAGMILKKAGVRQFRYGTIVSKKDGTPGHEILLAQISKSTWIAVSNNKVRAGSYQHLVGQYHQEMANDLKMRGEEFKVFFSRDIKKSVRAARRWAQSPD